MARRAMEEEELLALIRRLHQGQGVPLTLRAIRDAAGGGSLSTIAAARDRVLAEDGDTTVGGALERAIRQLVAETVEEQLEAWLGAPAGLAGSGARSFRVTITPEPGPAGNAAATFAGPADGEGGA